MLIRIFITNILSFDNEAEFSMIPGKGTLRKGHVTSTSKKNELAALKTSVVYGANASGKSNLIKVLRILQNIVTKNRDPGQNLPFEPFKLGKKNKGYSQLEIEIKVGGNAYAFGLKFTRKRIAEEWLYKINKSSERKIYERRSDRGETSVDLEKVKFDSKENQQFAHFVGRGTPENKTFLKESVDRNVHFINEIKDVYNWFDDNLKVFFPRTRFEGLEFHLDQDKDLEKSMTHFLKVFNTGVDGVITTKIDLEKDVKQELPATLVDSIINDLEPGKKAVVSSVDNKKSYAFERNKKGQIKAYKLLTKHFNQNNEPVYFDMDEESDGTRRIIDFIPMLVDLMKNDSVYVIDEIDRSLHPNLTKGLLEYYVNNIDNMKGQLIVTTHETNLLNLEVLRKDETWFVKKGKDGSSSLYSLLEFKPRDDKDIQKGYLNGRYGAIPFLASAREQ